MICEAQIQQPRKKCAFYSFYSSRSCRAFRRSPAGNIDLDHIAQLSICAPERSVNPEVGIHDVSGVWNFTLDTAVFWPGSSCHGAINRGDVPRHRLLAGAELTCHVRTFLLLYPEKSLTQVPSGSPTNGDVPAPKELRLGAICFSVAWGRGVASKSCTK